MVDANDIQIGGNHYKKSYQTWDFVVDTGMHYLLGTAVKYVSRWRVKGGLQDLEKAGHYIQKMIECVQEDRVEPVFHRRLAVVLGTRLTEFFNVQKLSDDERIIVTKCTTWSHTSDLQDALTLLNYVIAQNQNIDQGAASA